MIEIATMARILRHAGLESESTGESPTIATSTWPRGLATSDFRNAVSDCLGALEKLNHELNGEIPTSGSAHLADIPRSLVYSMSEIFRMIRECQESAVDPETEQLFGLELRRLESGWSAVLAGDVDDILWHVEQQESFR